MTSTAEQSMDVPVRKSITVKAGVDRAFEVFTAGIDSWWPREHHIGKSPMRKIIVEPKVGGRAYSEQIDGTECDWGSVLVWDPPRRIVLAWQITLKWEFEPDVAKSSEVEVRFTPLGNGTTRVDLEHRHLARHGEGFEAMRNAIGSPNGWSGTMDRFGARVEGRA